MDSFGNSPFFLTSTLSPILEIENDVLLKNLKEEQRIIDGIGDVFGKLYSDLGFESIIDGTRKDTECNSILKACTLSRLANPSCNRFVTVNDAKIAGSARWDGLHGIITNNGSEKAEKILARYQSLWQIEEAFRITMHDLRMPPIYHWSVK